MAIHEMRMIAAASLLVVAGCVTDEVAVYNDSVVNQQAAKRFLGEYQVEQWPGDMKPETIRVADKDGKLRFSYSLPEKKIDLEFVLSKIPSSEKDLYLLSIPAQADTNQANLFFIGRADKDQTYIWAVFSNLPVAKEHLSFEQGKAKADDVKTFLVKHADAFVTANEPQVTLRHEKR